MNTLLFAAALFLGAPQEVDSFPFAARLAARAFDVDAAGARVAVGYQDGSLMLLSAESGEVERELAPLGPAIAWALRFSPDGERLACVDHGGGLRILELESSASTEVLRALPYEERLEKYDSGVHVSWSPEGSRLLVMDLRGNAGLWTASGEFVRRLLVSDPPGLEQASWSTDGSVLFIANGSAVSAFRASDGEQGEPGSAPRSIECGEPVVAFALRPDGEQVVTGHDDGRFCMWDLSSGAKLGEGRFVDPFVHEPEDEVAALSYSPQGARLVFSTRQGSHVVVRDVASGERLWVSEFLGAHFSEVLRVAWDLDGQAVWCAFECGRGELVRFGQDGARTNHGSAHLPRFGAGCAVTLAGGDVVTFALDGTRRWRRVVRRWGEYSEAEIVDRADR